MEINSYFIINLICSMLGVYTKYEFIRKFFSFEKGKLKDLLMFAGYYGLIECVYLAFDIPLLTLMVNIIVLFLIVLTYNAGIKKAVFATLWITGIMVAVEFIVVFSTGYVLMPMQIITKNEYNSIFGLVLATILFYFIIIFIRKSGSVHSVSRVPMNYWVALFIVPFCSLYFFIVLLSNENNSSISITLMSILVLSMNFSIFKVYDRLGDYFEKKSDKEIAENLNTAYSLQLEMMKTIEENIYSFQHDLNKHMFTIQTLAKAGEIIRIEDYIDTINSKVQQNKIWSNSGNIIIDSIINYELSRCSNEHIKVTLNIEYVPTETKIKDYDLTIILSNLIHNAVEALEKEHSNKYLYIGIKYTKGILYIQVENSYDGVVLYNNKKIVTRKNNKKRHGYGNKNIHRIIDIYEGKIDYNVEPTMFLVKVFLLI